MHSYLISSLSSLHTPHNKPHKSQDHHKFYCRYCCQ
jgi:hypothetical protein